MIVLCSLLFLTLLILLCVKNPVLAWSLPFFGVMFGLPVSQFIPNSNYFIYTLQLTGICASIRLFSLSHNAEIKKRLWISILLLSYVSALGLLIGLNEVSFIVALQGVKLLFLPILLSIGAVNSEIPWDKIYKALVCLSFLQISVAITEYFIGVTKLLDLGLVYGTQIRQIEGQLRAPALFSTHFEFGLFSAAVFTTSLYVYDAGARIRSAWVRSGIFFGLIGVMLSTARTAILIVVVIFLLRRIETLDIPRRLLSVLSKLLILTLSCLILLQILPSVFTSGSVFSRFENWRNILSSFNVFFGRGVGIAGGATSSNFAEISQRIVVDNYILSLLVQFGLAGLALFLIAIKKFSLPSPRVSPILLSILVSFFTLETWEYYACISIMLMMQIRLVSGIGSSRV